ncbi:AbrB/MazE/SpoVT family DNA-binding domain-containing protein [Brucella intermedia]|uniref:AbrB/MazE/SpoVT family DNA-binding domain-containing protein n=1 Tax=Brucella intermedia TaxID=94625 RepID=UPI001591B608|nr:AbrB/MazE/SpoVT family DNA-binding domain-containing protein [Brucella intermedia]
MIANVAKWGNSLALRIPNAFAREIDVKEGAKVELSVIEGAIILRPVEEPAVFDLDTLLSGITEENLHSEVATGPSVGNEF